MKRLFLNKMGFYYFEDCGLATIGGTHELPQFVVKAYTSLRCQRQYLPEIYDSSASLYGANRLQRGELDYFDNPTHNYLKQRLALWVLTRWFRISRSLAMAIPHVRAGAT
jgi:hypothetical protein